MTWGKDSVETGRLRLMQQFLFSEGKNDLRSSSRRISDVKKKKGMNNFWRNVICEFFFRSHNLICVKYLVF